jgi:hypothetical protein
VSLLSPDTLSLYISPDRIQAVKASGLAQRPVEVHQRNASVQAADGWQGMARVCLELVRQSQAKRLHIVLSDKLARYAGFAWQDALRTDDEDMSLAKLNFDDVYGAQASADWHFGFSAASPGQSRLLVAIPKTLFSVLQDNFGQKQPRVLSVRTAFTATLQAHRQRMGANGWLINLEEGRLTFGCWTNHAWSWIYSVHAELETPEELLARIRQEIQLASTSLKEAQLLQIFIHAPVFEHLPFGSLAGVQFIQLKTPLADPGPKYAYALMGVKA